MEEAIFHLKKMGQWESLVHQEPHLSIPLMTEAIGIHQSDIIIRTAIVAAMADLRAHPDLLDYVFASLPKDDLTHKDYGEKSVQAAKDWFLKTKIPVTMVPRLDQAQAPLITIKLTESSEDIVTLGDVHYQPEEVRTETYPALAGPFNPVSYNPATGIMVLPSTITDVVNLAPNMVIVDTVGRQHTILLVNDDDSITIQQGMVADFRNAVLKGAQPVFKTSLESVSYRENYQIGVHVAGEPVMLTWLHSIIIFCLLRYKQSLLEARGFERSVVNSTDFDRNDYFEAENVFSRYVSITGYVRQYWPKFTAPTAQSLKAQIVVSEGIQLPVSIWTPEDPNDP